MDNQGCEFTTTWGRCGRPRWIDSPYCCEHDDDVKRGARNRRDENIRATLASCLRAAHAGQKTIDVDGARIDVRVFAAAQIGRHLAKVAREEFGDALTAEAVAAPVGRLKARTLACAEFMANVERALLTH